MNNVAIFFHIAAVNKYQSLFEEMFTEVIECGLLDACDKATLCVVGNADLMLPESDKIEVIYDPEGAVNHQTSVEYGEFFTLTKLKEFADSCDVNTKILYTHLRGVTSPQNTCIPSWRKYMTYWNITKFQESLDLLNSCDACGVDLIDKSVWPYASHFSGNMWWANSDYIKTLPQISEIDHPGSEQKATLRHNGEFWIGMKDGNLVSKNDADVDICSRHLIKCPEEYYNGNVS
jgi:hypothetical protein